MSLLPLLVNLADEIDSSPFYRRDNNFGFGIQPSQIFSSMETPRLGLLHQPRYFPLNRWNRDDSRASINKSQIGKDGYQVCMDVEHFAPNEISVKIVDNSIVVEGNHEDRKDEHGYISRQFKRRYALPEGFNLKDVVSTLSSDGVLTVKVPPVPKSLESNERVIQIQQTGPAHLSIGNKEKAPESAKDKKMEQN